MKTIAENSAIDKSKVRHYASYLINGQEVCGIARLIGGGYYFTPEVGESRLVSYKDVDLILYGRCDLVAAADLADGDRVVRCSQTVRS
jgi:hypothetical protein